MAIFKPSEAKVQQLLDELAEAKEKQAALRNLHAQIVADHPKLQQIQTFMDEQADTIDSLTEKIKTAVLQHGQTIKGSQLQAVWAKGRTGWDTRGLIGFAVAHPEMNQFKTTGDPTVSIRKV